MQGNIYIYIYMNGSLRALEKKKKKAFLWSIKIKNSVLIEKREYAFYKQMK